MAFSKVILNGETLMDVTGDNPTSSNMLTGTKATGADGRSVNGAVVTAPASDTTPAMDGNGSAGSENTYSRGDHVHPKDTTKLDKSGGTLTGALTLSGAPTANLHAATKKYVDDAIGGVNSFDVEVVSTLPTTNIKTHTIYFVSKTGETGDVYDEYMYINNTWEHIGSTDIDLSGYVPTSRTVNGKALTGNISLTASDVGASTTDQKLITNQTTNGNVYYPVVGNSTTNSETKYYNNDFRFKPAANLTELQLGQVSNNSTKAGQLTLCSGAYYTYLKPPSYSVIDNNKTYTLPNATGTIALTSDIPDVSGKQDKPTISSVTLAVASWSNGVYSFESTYPNASYNIDVEPDGYTITDAQFKAWNEAKIVGNSNGNTIKALGTVPAVAIPIVVRATPK